MFVHLAGKFLLHFSIFQFIIVPDATLHFPFLFYTFKGIIAIILKFLYGDT